jgi:RIO kinase 1
MKSPECFDILILNGQVDEVVSRLMSGKEADVYVVQSKGELCCAKVYKDIRTRSFSLMAQYLEGR